MRQTHLDSGRVLSERFSTAIRQITALPGTHSPPAPPAASTAGNMHPGRIVRSPGSTITLTAVNGPVQWTITEPSSLLGEVTVSPSSGTLAAGKSTDVTVSGSASLDTQLSVNPGALPSR
jgi:hypothetical protein